jgi:hypothetical protein
MKFLYFFIATLFLMSCGGSNSISKYPCNVDYSGDSLVQQSNDKLQIELKKLQADCKVQVHGFPGESARDRMEWFKQYVNTLPVSTTIALAYGANEALAGMSADQFEADAREMIAAAGNRKVVWESVWLMTNPQNNAPALAIEYRARIRKIGIPVSDSVLRQDTWDGGGIHPSDEHYVERAKALALIIFNNL